MARPVLMAMHMVTDHNTNVTRLHHKFHRNTVHCSLTFYRLTSQS